MMENKKTRAVSMYLLFFLSGISGLIYEVIWVRVFGNFFGNTIYSAALVTSVFMLGLGIGSYAAGVWSDRRYYGAKALEFFRVYGRVEIGIAVSAAFIAQVLPGLQRFAGFFARYAPDARGWQHLSLLTHLGQFTVAAILMLPVTILMGATLSLLIRQLLADDVHAAGWKIGALYGFNTAGAALGCFSTDLLLVPLLGIQRSQWVAVALNLAVGGTAIFLTRNAAQGPPSSAPRPARESPRPLSLAGTAWPIALALFFSGLAAMGMEIVWFRLLSASLGEFRVVFSLLLTVVLVGIWLGSLAGGISVKRWGHPLERYMLVQALFIVITPLLLVMLSGSAAESYLMKRMLRLPAETGLSWFTQIWGLLRPILAVIGLPSLLIGFSFPLANAYVQRLEDRVGRQAGKLYLANTLGSVFGALVAGFVLLPLWGSQCSVLVLCFASGLAILFLQVARVKEHAAATWRSRNGLFLLCTVAAIGVLFLWSRLPANYLIMRSFPRLGPDQKILQVSEGLNEMLMVIEDPTGQRFLLTNGHSMSGTAPRLQRYMRAFVHIPLLQARSPQSVLVICFGVGNTLQAASLHPTVQRLEVVDLSEQILEHAGFFAGSNRNILADERVAVFINDGRLHLHMAPPSSYDLITLEPPPIAFAGVSSLYSREFYRLARSRLKPGGFVSQWLPLYQVSPQAGLSMVRAFLDVFPDAVLHSGMKKELILVGRSGASPVMDPDLCSLNLAVAPAVQADLDRVNLGTLTEIVGTFAAHGRDLERVTRDVRPVTDDNRLLEYNVLSKFSDTGLPGELFQVAGVAAWCPKCFANDRSRADLVWLGKYLEALDALYHSTAFLFFRGAWGAMKGSDIDLIDRDGSLGAVVSRYPYLQEALASPLTGSLAKIVRREWADPAPGGSAPVVHSASGPECVRMAMKLLRAGRLGDAISWFHRAVELDGGDASARFGLGYALFYAQDYDAAWEQYRQGLELAPANLEARFSLAVVSRRLGRLEDEIAALEHVLRQKPDHARAAARLGMLRPDRAAE
jgi:predicted membrane-bound spermidine synthase